MPAPIRMRIEVPGDLEAIRRWLLRLAPRMEAQQPGITEQLRTVDMSTPMRMVTPRGMVINVAYEPLEAARTAIKVQVDPPLIRTRPGGWWWATRTRWIVRFTLKLIRTQLAREATPPVV